MNRRKALSHISAFALGSIVGVSSMKVIGNTNQFNQEKNMGKKILVLASSARKGGNSDVLSGEFMRGAEAAGHTTEKIYLADNNIKGCIGCGACRNNGGNCIQRDDMTHIYEKVLNADVIVFASPVYYYTFNAQMKTAMDRLYAIIQTWKDRTAYMIATGAGPDRALISSMIDCFRHYIGCYTNIREGGIVYGGGVSNIGDVANTSAMLEAYEMGSKV
ncbi:flavodoxin family protein [Parabacteroides sp. PF5-9]|uniref:flavodoxin family protein n=1 Tax=Parabacteroides sp. PF5-9 TaxID=1742404 RepID=UPI002472F547|nr:flavodoxin family protein [Parabacteroides sp. PF5-9]MDH6357496.1 multimeric flavodoxin WrbA [Parabacteroides sp. PF5-9]